jgi:hypothetical protein
MKIKLSFNNFLRFLIFGSMLFSIFSRFSNENTCYTCDNQVIVLLFILHSVLYLATYQKRPLLKLLIFTLLVFFVSRLGTMQFDLDYFGYRNFIPTVLQMREILLILFLASVSLLAGCFAGERVRFKKSENYRLLWASSIKDESLYYSYLTFIFIFTSLVLIFITIAYKYSPTIDHRLYDQSVLIVTKILRSFSFLSVLPIAWFIIRKPSGFERKITIFAIFLFIFSTVLTGSKIALISLILPFLFVYYVSGIRISRRTTIIILSIVALSILVYPILGSLRTIVQAMIVSSNPETYAYLINTTQRSTFGDLNILTTFFRIASRVGSSFDVLSFIVPAKDLFVPYANLSAEVIDVVNGYYPGELIKVDAPQWARILPSLGHNKGLAWLMNTGAGENIGLISHLFINFGIFGVCFWSFFITFLYGMSYNYFNTFFRIMLCIWIILSISNGSGFIKMLIDIPILLILLMFLRISFRLIRPFIQAMPNTMQKNNSLSRIVS